MKITKAMVLCAGFGKRLRPLTSSNPKPLLEIGNKTLLSNTLDILRKFGIKQAVLNVHYLGDKIVDYVKSNEFNLKVTTVVEKDKILDTGGGVLNALQYFSKEPFIVINPDTVWNSNYLDELKDMEKDFFINKKIKCLLLIVNKNKSFDPSIMGDFNLENNLVNRKDKENLKYIYTGIQILKPNVFDNLNLKIFSINRIWDKLIENNNLFAKESNIDFTHISNLDIYKSLLKKYFKH